MYDSKYLESDAFLMACEKDEEVLEKHLEQFLPGELRKLRQACSYLASACAAELASRT